MSDSKHGVLVALVLLAGLFATAMAAAQRGSPAPAPRPPHVTSAARAPAELRACRADTDCTLAYTGCCPTCGTIRTADLRAVARRSEGAWRRHECPGHRTIACPACESMPDVTAHAVCRRNLCEMVVTPAPSPTEPTIEQQLGVDS